MNKSQLRQQIKSSLTAIDVAHRASASASACARLASASFFETCGSVMLYLPIGSELDVEPLVAASLWVRHVAVPLVDWEAATMQAVRLRHLDAGSLDVGPHGVRSPAIIEPVALETIDLIVVPGVAFDIHGGRLGRGGGFYDRFLRDRAPRTLAVGIAFEEQIVETVPTEPHDVRLDAVVTNARTIRPEN